MAAAEVMIPIPAPEEKPGDWRSLVTDIFNGDTEGLICTAVTVNHQKLDTVICQMTKALQAQNKFLERNNLQLHERINLMATRMDRFSALLDGSETNPLGERVTDLERRVGHLGNQHLVLEQRMDTTDTRVSNAAVELSEEFDSLTAEFNKNVDKTNNHLNTELDKIVTYCNQIHDEVKARKEDITDVRYQIRELDKLVKVTPTTPTSTTNVTKVAFTEPVNKKLVKDVEKLQTQLLDMAATVEQQEVQRREAVRVTEERLAQKVDISCFQQEIAKKADLQDHLRQVQHVDELFTKYDRLSKNVDTLTKEFKNTAISHLLDEAFEKRLGNIYTELFRLDKHKADRTELEEWITKIFADQTNPTSVQFRCLSCNRTAGPLVEAMNSKKAMADFPPSTMFMSSLGHKERSSSPGTTVGGGVVSSSILEEAISKSNTLKGTHTATTTTQANTATAASPGTHRKLRKKAQQRTITPPPTTDPNGPARKKLHALYDWLKGRHEEESIRSWVQAELKISPDMLGLDKNADPMEINNPNSTIGRDGRLYGAVVNDEDLNAVLTAAINSASLVAPLGGNKHHSPDTTASSSNNSNNKTGSSKVTKMILKPKPEKEVSVVSSDVENTLNSDYEGGETTDTTLAPLEELKAKRQGKHKIATAIPTDSSTDNEKSSDFPEPIVP